MLIICLCARHSTSGGIKAPAKNVVAATMKCSVCGHVYDPVKDGGGKAFADLPDSWICPVCGAPKSAYKASVDVGKIHEVGQRDVVRLEVELLVRFQVVVLLEFSLCLAQERADLP